MQGVDVRWHATNQGADVMDLDCALDEKDIRESRIIVVPFTWALVNP
jgi:hypothetical protein